MGSIEDIVKRMRANPKGIRYREAYQVCEAYFGKPRSSASSHCVFKTPWSGDPRVNIQNDRGMAKPYQVRQILSAIERLEAGGSNASGS